MASRGKPPEDYPRDSFDRMGDDLCQLVLSYHDTEDRFLHQCVSKQWKRLIFKSQHRLIIEKRFVYQWRTDWNIWRNILEKCQNVSAVELVRDDIVYPEVYRLMEEMAKYLPHIQSYEVHSNSSESHTNLYGLIDRIVAFKELRHLSIDCPRVYGNSNPCANAMNKVALNCPHIQSLSLRVNCFVAPNLINIFKAMQWFAQLERLHLGLYEINWNEPREYSVKPLLECRRLKWVSLESAPDFEFIDVDQLRALVPRVIITKGTAWR